MGRPREITDEAIMAAARRCFLERGVQISAQAIAKELGVSHTTLFNRFGSKEGLLIAALGPPRRLPWAERLAEGPDERPVTAQLEEICEIIAAYLEDTTAGIMALQSAGVPADRLFERHEDPTPRQAFRALHGWLDRAHHDGLLRSCDTAMLSGVILGTLHSWAFTRRLLGQHRETDQIQGDIRAFVQLLWQGIEPAANQHTAER